VSERPAGVSASARLPRALVIGPLPPPPGGVGRLVEAILASPLRERWSLDVFDLSKPQQEGKPGVVTPWDVAWTLVHLVALPWRLVTRRPAVALVQSTADSGYVRDLALILICRTFGVPVVVQWHGAPDWGAFPGTGARRSLWRFGMRRARRVVLLAESYRPSFERHLEPERIAVVPNFVDGEAIERAASFTRAASHRALVSGTDRGALSLVCVGRVGPAKGTDILLDAIAALRARGLDVRATLVGDGETAEAWRAAGRHAAVRSGAVQLTGALGEERFAELGRADAFVLPTRADSFPLAILEAMGAGLPVVSSPLGAIPWMLEDGRAGVLVPPGDAVALATALESLAHDPALRERLAAAARDRQRGAFDSRVASRSLDAILAQAAGR
jgi:glycosyltransferase involved in cell wall biosynthesis